MNAVYFLVVGRSWRVSEMRARIVEMMVRKKISRAIAPYVMYPRERHPTPNVGVKTAIMAAAAVVPHWRIRAKIDAWNIEVSAPGGNTKSLAGRVAMISEIVFRVLIC